jgi:hypothetical protein
MDPEERAEDSDEQNYGTRMPDFRVLLRGVRYRLEREDRRKAMRAKMLAKFRPRLLRRRGI